MPDGQHFSSFLSDLDAPPEPPAYTPPVAVVLQGLDISELDLAPARVSVDTRFLRLLIGEIARRCPFDAEFYAEANPDVEAARLAGDVKTLHEHFLTQGYFERRRPHPLPFDAGYYARQYDDLARAFDGADAETLERHFVQHGWQEGRVAIAAQRTDADRWIEAARLRHDAGVRQDDRG